jgi:hypothetical protein
MRYEVFEYLQKKKKVVNFKCVSFPVLDAKYLNLTHMKVFIALTSYSYARLCSLRNVRDVPSCSNTMQLFPAVNRKLVAT